MGLDERPAQIGAGGARDAADGALARVEGARRWIVDLRVSDRIDVSAPEQEGLHPDAVVQGEDAAPVAAQAGAPAIGIAQRGDLLALRQAVERGQGVAGRPGRIEQLGALDRHAGRVEDRDDPVVAGERHRTGLKPELASQERIRRVEPRLDQRTYDGKGLAALENAFGQVDGGAVGPGLGLVAVGAQALEIQGGERQVGGVVRADAVDLADQAVCVRREGAPVGIDVGDAVALEQGGVGRPLRAEAPDPVLVRRDVEQAAGQDVAPGRVVVEVLVIVELFGIGIARPDVDHS